MVEIQYAQPDCDYLASGDNEWDYVLFELFDHSVHEHLPHC